MRFVLYLFILFLLVANTHAEQWTTIKDMVGREVKIPKKVDRIVALNASLRYVVYLQAFDQVVGVEDVEKQGSMRGNTAVGRAYWNVIKDRVQTIPTIGEGGPGKLPDFEKIIAVKPDLIITFEMENANLIQSKTGIPVVVLHYAGPEGFKIEDIKRTFIFLGKLLQREKRAQELNSYIDNLILDLIKRTKNSISPTVYVGAISARGSHGITSTEAHYPPLKWLNVKNVADETGREGHIFIDKEKLLFWNPDYIFIDTNGLTLVNEDYLKNKEFYKKLKAVKEGRVYSVFPYNFYRTNLEILFANSYFIGKTLYPDRFKDIHIDKKCGEIMRKFLFKDVFPELKRAYRGYGKVEFGEKGITIR